MRPKLFDTHCHLNFKSYQDDRDILIKKTLDSQVWMGVVGSQYSTSKRAVEIAQVYQEGVYAIIGLHPIHVVDISVDEEEYAFSTVAEEFKKDEYKALAQSPKVVGIGECGLEYFHLPDQAKAGDKIFDKTGIIELQKKVFISQIELAQELDKALMVHIRQGQNTKDSQSESGPNAYDDTYNILKNYQLPVTSYQLRTVIHCFSGSLDHARAFLDLGCYIAIGGIVTFKNAHDLRAVVKEIPLERLLLETDAPYLAPDPHRGTRNEPLYTEFVAKKIADVKGVSPETVMSVTTQNALDVFKIKM